jgi:hypothetical protein
MRYCTRLTLAITFACTLNGMAQPANKTAAKPRPAAKHTPKAPVLTPFEQAVAVRDALENKPSGQATRADYNAVLDQFRAIYHANPADQHAPDSIFAVAELLSEAGAQLPDPKLSQAAVGQYEATTAPTASSPKPPSSPTTCTTPPPRKINTRS